MAKISSEVPINGVKVFSATMVQDRQVLGEKVSEWMARNPTFEINEIKITQSSDQAFHCIAITVFYNDPKVASRTVGAITTGA